MKKTTFKKNLIQTVILNGGINNYLISTTKICSGLYETAVFPVIITHELDFPLTSFYKVEWDFIDKVNYQHWWEALWYHFTWVHNWHLNKKNFF